MYVSVKSKDLNLDLTLSRFIVSNQVTTHSAPGQMLGYLFQIDRALFWLSLSQVSFVAIETEDDVVAIINGQKQFEQDKSTISNRNPFSNHSKDLWKSIFNWLNLINTKGIDTSAAKFSLATNKEIKSKCLLIDIVNSKTDTEYEECYNRFLDIASNANSNIRPFTDGIQGFSKSEIINLFKAINLFHGKDLNDRINFKEKIRNNLSVGKHLPFNAIYDRLYSWVANELFEKWRSGDQAHFSRDQFTSLLSGLIAEYNDKPFIELTKECIPIIVDDDVKQEHLTANFIRQLDIISADEDDKIKAINDFLRAAWQRTNDANEGIVTDYYYRFEDDLRVKWNNCFKKYTKFLGSDDTTTLMKVGYDIYMELIDKKEKLAGFETTQFHTTNGTYHKLSNQLDIGWHPKWEKKLKSDGK